MFLIVQFPPMVFPRNRCSAFTLVELLAVMAIIVLLMVLVVPALQQNLSLIHI